MDCLPRSAGLDHVGSGSPRRALAAIPGKVQPPFANRGELVHDMPQVGVLNQSVEFVA
jgi:hypothetical protein